MMMNRSRNVRSYFVVMVITLFILLLMPSSFLVEAQDYPSFVNGPKNWRISPSNRFDGIWLHDNSTMSPILRYDPYVCAFHCSSNRDNCLFSISILLPPQLYSYQAPQTVWSANRNKPVDSQAVLELTSEGELILKDASNTLIWSVGNSVSGLNLSAEGNLMLLDKTNRIVWQSFDHPTDSLVRGQRLVSGQELRSSVSPQNSSEGLYAFAIINGHFTAYMVPDPSQFYYKRIFREDYTYNHSGQYYADFQPGRFGRLHNIPDTTVFIQFGSDGHLKAYDYGWNPREVSYWNVTDLPLDIDRCSYPSACGNYGVCFEGGCNCPDHATKSETPYFRPTNSLNPEFGCDAISPITCELSHHHTFLHLPGYYFQSIYSFAFSDTNTITEEDCKEACLKNCSCKAVLYRKGYCQFLSQVLSIKKIDYKTGNASDYSNSAFIKVQNVSVSRKKHRTQVIVGSTLGSILGVFVICIFIFLRSKKRFREVEEDFLDNMLGMPTRFSYKELRNATNSFSNKLGKGGFGSVFHGTLASGFEVAVKHLVGFGPVNKSFLAEVQTIGSIHHCNLVTLVGFCAEKLNRLLVYEYMVNGSLDRWIFNKNQDSSLGWKIRKKIILDIAKGLAYLHEECNQKIIHLDIKPQNILLDQNFNAKVSDFGLCKLIGKDQSHVFTAIRGTPGYMAPEWLSSSITEKADVYSFGIVVLEILCGRRNFEGSEEVEDRHLVGVFRRKQEEGKVMDLVEKCSNDMQSNADEVAEMMKVAAWCLQTEYARRPSMSTVVKLFEGSIDDASNMNEEMSIELLSLEAMEMSGGSTILPSMLSGPR